MKEYNLLQGYLKELNYIGLDRIRYPDKKVNGIFQLRLTDEYDKIGGKIWYIEINVPNPAKKYLILYSSISSKDNIDYLYNKLYKNLIMYSLFTIDSNVYGLSGEHIKVISIQTLCMKGIPDLI